MACAYVLFIPLSIHEVMDVDLRCDQRKKLECYVHIFYLYRYLSLPSICFIHTIYPYLTG